MIGHAQGEAVGLGFPVRKVRPQRPGLVVASPRWDRPAAMIGHRPAPSPGMGLRRHWGWTEARTPPGMGVGRTTPGKGGFRGSSEGRQTLRTCD
jgi:hypothetical protein